MRAILASLAVVFLLCGPARADEPAVSSADADAIHGVIQGQLDAFQHDDGPAAFAFAAPSIQRMFGKPDVFLDMVRRGYAPVYRPRSAEFGGLGMTDGVVAQNVELIGPDGMAYTARYTLERQPDGLWRISGCELVPSRRLGV